MLAFRLSNLLVIILRGHCLHFPKTICCGFVQNKFTLVCALNTTQYLEMMSSYVMTLVTERYKLALEELD